MIKKTTYFLSALVVFFMLQNCNTDDIRNIAGPTGGTNPNPPLSTEVNPIDINVDGFDFLDKMQGHWVGRNRVIADDYDFFAFDYRANSPSQIHGIFEGGSMGNLFTSFFVTDFKGKRTIMARNGGVLSGIYRTSYFVMDKIEDNNNGKYFRFVDSRGGANTMFMELRFKQDSLYFNAYTSRLGVQAPASRHMTFKGKKSNLDLAQTAAQEVGFPQNTPAWDFSEGFVEENLYVNPGDAEAQSATFLAQSAQNDVFDLAYESGDPWRIDQHPYLALLQIDIEINPEIEGKSLTVFLSKAPLTDEYGYFVSDESAFNSILLFSELTAGESQFLITYLHPGQYNVNITADINEDGYISEGDITHANQTITITPEGQHQLTINNITVEN
ncbi:hypothetical protein [Winogradskyella sp.]|uniref:hypothetical protein n=1 Tax=Winogradskyella sp. TaxID=1883156 RepID=UPI002600BD07|nr:hypothetical protein [Winogradskyella sp.]